MARLAELDADLVEVVVKVLNQKIHHHVSNICSIDCQSVNLN